MANYQAMGFAHTTLLASGSTLHRAVTLNHFIASLYQSKSSHKVNLVVPLATKTIKKSGQIFP